MADAGRSCSTVGPRRGRMPTSYRRARSLTLGQSLAPGRWRGKSCLAPAVATSHSATSPSGSRRAPRQARNAVTAARSTWRPGAACASATSPRPAFAHGRHASVGGASSERKPVSGAPHRRRGAATSSGRQSGNDCREQPERPSLPDRHRVELLVVELRAMPRGSSSGWDSADARNWPSGPRGRPRPAPMARPYLFYCVPIEAVSSSRAWARRMCGRGRWR
jgi:hypothetical protein